MNFSRFLDIQSWWEVPSIAYFCSLFRTAFNLLDFDIEELEEALLADGTEESASSLLTELIVRLLNGCFGNNDVSAFNYQMYLRRLFRRKCQDTSRDNPFNTDIDFQFLPLRTKVEILYTLCDFRLDAEDVLTLFKNLEAESLRVEPLGWDANDSAYWYFYGTRLYREDVIKKAKGKSKKKKNKEGKKRGWFYGDDWLDDDNTERVWQVVCFTEDDWTHLTEKFSKTTVKVEKELYRSLSQNFLPEIPRLFQEKERLQRKRLLEAVPRRTSSRVLQKIKQKEEENKPSESESKETEEDERKENDDDARENRAKRRDLLRTRSQSSDSSDSSTDKEMPQKVTKRPKGQDRRSKNSSATNKGEPPPQPPVKTGRKTNNSLASATGQILIPDTVEPVNSTRKKLKTSQIQTEEDIQTDMYKVLEQLTAHEDAWPFMDPVEEEYAPNYYAVIRRPMDLRKMEERLDSGYYTDFSIFKGDFKLIVNNCRLYNGQDNEYTTMVDNLQAAFDRLTEKYITRVSSSDEEIAVEYQIPTPSRKHKLKRSESPTNHKRKKRRSHSDTGEGKSSDPVPDSDVEGESPKKDTKESHHKTKEGKIKKKRHHRHGKHSKTHKKGHKSEHTSKSSKHSKKQKHSKDKESKKQKKKRLKRLSESKAAEKSEREWCSDESGESSARSRSPSPLPPVRTPSPEPVEPPATDFCRDKYDTIKERRRAAATHAFEALVEHKHKNKHHTNTPEKDKNPKLSETIEKLKAKNEKYKESALFGTLDSKDSRAKRREAKLEKKSVPKDVIDDSDYPDEDTYDHEKEKEKQRLAKKGRKKGKTTTKNECASEALEQAVKDISKWLEDAPKDSSGSSPSDSPTQTISTEEQDSRGDDEFLITLVRPRKRPSSREPKLLKRREVQRTIGRLQPGKSKGNLISNIGNKSERVEDFAPTAETPKVESSPKLSLGSVLPTVEFTLGKDHNFADDAKKDEKKEEPTEPPAENEEKVETPQEEPAPKETIPETKKEEPVEVPKPDTIDLKLSQEKATPNLSAWFKAFGTPKSNTPSAAPVVKKKVRDSENEDKPTEIPTPDPKPASPKNIYDSPREAGTPNPEDIEAPSRMRRASTGSSVSERSSFSQDLDSPRHQVAHSSPMLPSPASPRSDDLHKITYPIMNGTVRAGFYQDTTSVKSSPDKSCSPREAPQSPYSPYSQHVYASNSVPGSTAPNYFVDHNKSPVAAYTQSQVPPYYDKPALGQRPRGPEDYSSVSAESYQDSGHYGGSYSPVASPYASNPTYSQPERSPLTPHAEPADIPKPAHFTADTKINASYPVKKRTYSEIDTTSVTIQKANDKDTSTPVSSSEYQKVHIMPVQAVATSTVDNIASALSERSRYLKDKTAANYINRLNSDNRLQYDSLVKRDTFNKSNSRIHASTTDNVDMVNMGYMNPEQDPMRSHGIQCRETPYSTPANTREAHKPITTNQPKAYEIDAIAMNLGIHSHNNVLQKGVPTSGPIPMAHCHERTQERSFSHALMHQHHPQYDTGSANNFSLTDIELANKKLYASGVASSTAIDYGGWKMSNQLRKPDVHPSDYSAYATSAADKMKMDLSTSSANAAAISYSKNLQHAQYNPNYNVPRSSLPRPQDIQQNLPAELRIPNPRNLIKTDHVSTTTMTNSEISKSMENATKSQKSDKFVPNHRLVGSHQYKTPYSTHSAIESLRNLPNFPQMLERYTNDEQRYLSSLAAAGGASLYHDKTFQMAQMFTKSMASSSDTHAASTSSSVYSQSPLTMSKEASAYKAAPTQQSTQSDLKTKAKRKRTTDTKSPILSNQSYHSNPHSSDMLQSIKPSMVPGSAFNFGTTPNMALGTGLYAENSAFSMEDFRNSTANQLMAANYMAAAAAAGVAASASSQRATGEGAVSADKGAKGGHQKYPLVTSAAAAAAARGGYGFMGAEYQQYLQRHQEELLRQTMSLYPPGYPALAARHQYDAINRPSWL